MTVEQMIIGVNIGVQKVDSNAYDNIIPEEMLYYLNKATREYVRRQTIYLKESLKEVSRKDFIADSEANNNLSTILDVKTYDEADLADNPNYDNVKQASVSDINMYSFVYGQAKPASSSGWRPVKEISSSDIHLYTKTDYNDAIFRRYPVVKIGTNLNIFYDAEGEGITTFILTYIKAPLTLVLDGDIEGVSTTTSELPEHSHDDIVNLAVAMISEDLKSARPYEQNQTTIKGE